MRPLIRLFDLPELPAELRAAPGPASDAALSPLLSLPPPQRSVAHHGRKKEHDATGLGIVHIMCM